ncbi:hypothetical protein RND81_12G204100 [Saponaria officinalis]|uniref:Uncharacterized protein n=1 Tax=Saponaria officinalis TaxID=3572 RepID=A0AAW1HD41_SAPOF
MANYQIKIIITITTILISSSITTSSKYSPPKTVHQLLHKKGLPQGLIPKEVKSYEYNEQNGLLIVHFDAPCLAKYDNLVKFDKVVRANLSFGELLGVEGLSQEELFIWLDVKEISVKYVKSGLILFDIGMARQHLSLSLFELPPSCDFYPGKFFGEICFVGFLLVL